MSNNPSLLEMMLELELPLKHGGTKLTTGQKDALRAQARRGRDGITQWKKRCAYLKRIGQDCHIHHAIPLQYIHLFKGRNPNRTTNVLLVSTKQHQKIHAALRKVLENAKDKKKALEKFRNYLLKTYTEARVPRNYKDKILREILQELQLTGIIRG